MATIYRAVDLRMGRTVAAKILREVYSSDPKFVTRFQREVKTLALDDVVITEEMVNLVKEGMTRCSARFRRPSSFRWPKSAD